jgi:hypothetical protein
MYAGVVPWARSRLHESRQQEDAFAAIDRKLYFVDVAHVGNVESQHAIIIGGSRFSPLGRVHRWIQINRDDLVEQAVSQQGFNDVIAEETAAAKDSDAPHFCV